MTNKILLTIFSMMAGLELDFISEGIKEGLQARKEMEIKVVKLRRVIKKQCTM